jgi:hypothetical protein
MNDDELSTTEFEAARDSATEALHEWIAEHPEWASKLFIAPLAYISNCDDCRCEHRELK